MEAIEAAKAGKFTLILGSNVNTKWFESLMQYSGPYLFTAALFLFVLKLGISIYQYIKSPNKNINEKVSLGWTILETALIGTAVVGSLVAATLFAVVTPALFFATMAADTLRNIGFFFWNIGKLALLKYSVGKQLSPTAETEPTIDDHLTKLKYQDLKKKYVGKIKAHGLGIVIGLVVTVAVGIVFLFPHIGLAAVGTTAFVVAGIKMTVAGVAGLAAAGALTLPLIPTVYKLAKWGLPKIGNGIKNGVSKVVSLFKSENKKEEQSSLIITEDKTEDKKVQPKQAPILSVAQHDDFVIIQSNLDKAIDHNLKFSVFGKHSQYREIIIDHISDKVTAKLALQKMVDKKILILVSQLRQSTTRGYHYFTEKQRPKRQQKLYALLLIKQQLNDQADPQLFNEYDNDLKNSAKLNHFTKLNKNSFDDINDLIAHIKTSLPGVQESLLLDQSDTLNIVVALQKYADKFEEKRNDVAVNM